MTTSADIRTAWATFVWTAASITALTTNIYDYAAADLAAESETDNAKLLENQVYNFFQYKIEKLWDYQLTGQVFNQFRVRVEYFKQASVTGSFNAVEDAFETVHTAMRANLGDNWNSTIDGFTVQTEPANIMLVKLQGVPVWRGAFTYIGFKTSAL